MTRILDHYSKIVVEHARTIKPPGIQDAWGTDEKEQKIRGEKRWIVAVMDLTTPCILAWDLSKTKENHDAVPLLRTARDRAGRIPRLFITDGLNQYHIAFKKVFYTLGLPNKGYLCAISSLYGGARAYDQRPNRTHFSGLGAVLASYVTGFDRV